MARKPGYKNPNAGRKKIPVIMKLPEKTIVWEQVLFWINLQASREEIAGSFHVSTSTLDRRILETFGMNFEELKKRTDGESKICLRRYQFQQAEKNASMAIWLGKQWLGQRDTSKEEIKELAAESARQAIIEIERESRISETSKQRMENEQSLLDQRFFRKQSEIPTQLGADDTLERSSSMQDSLESKTARYNDIFMPPFP